MGWGQTCPDTEDPACLPQQLREADTRVEPAETCLPPTPTDLCIGARDGSIGPENMDSGGPAVVMANGVWTLVGTVEGGNGTGAPGPSLFTNVTVYRDWVDGYVSGRTQIPPDSPFPSDSLNAAARIGDCSGSVIESASSQPSDPAMVLTNGHCVQPRPEPGAAVVDQPRRVRALLKDDNGQTLLRAYTTRLIYATMTGTDVALYQLDRTYDQLAAGGVKARALATSGPRPGQRMKLLAAGTRRSCRKCGKRAGRSSPRSGTGGSQVAPARRTRSARDDRTGPRAATRAPRWSTRTPVSSSVCTTAATTRLCNASRTTPARSTPPASSPALRAAATDSRPLCSPSV